ncbi:MAG TPA: PfkB family carbohydrate kinase [Trebonia sp.]|jgi:sugar/nucleoside kinase (ribokinase family)|nr:PfkB family carbohydrate kinase [Trebonia sp.]
MASPGARARPTPTPAALFAGLCTFDLIQSVTRMPGPNEKVTAARQLTAAGGPATNASVTFAFLGGHATLLTGVGRHPLAAGMRADLRQEGVRLIDAAETDDSPPSVSSIIVTQGTGDRCVVSRNAAGRTLDPPPDLAALVDEAQVVLIDGHHRALAVAAARAARERGRLCIMDGGSWKPVTAELVPHVDIAVCSADFRPPGQLTKSADDTLAYLLDSGVPWAVITDGPRPVRWASRAHGIQPDILVPVTEVADTLGAGDVFHGAFTHAIAACAVPGVNELATALQFAATVAAHSCQAFGTRAWMTSWAARP